MKKETEKMIAVMQAYVDGAQIEVREANSKHWGLSWSHSQGLNVWNWSSYRYRVKEQPKEPEYVPFTFEDAEHLIGKPVKHKKDSWVEVITYCNENETSSCMYEDLLRDYTFLDGSPCGKLKQ